MTCRNVVGNRSADRETRALPGPGGRAGIGWLLGSLLIVTPVRAQPFAPVDHPAIVAPRAAEALLLDVARAGHRLVAVGAQGVIVTSDDHGVTWTQSPAVPVSTLLTAVAFADAQHGWVAGHGGVVLRSLDGGSSWQRTPLAGLDAGGPGSATPATGMEDLSFLDAFAVDERHVLLAAAYGMLLVTRDGGATWTKLAPPIEDLHINRLTRGRDGALYAAGESGMLAVSREDGASWEVFESPYDGSFYGLHELSNGRLLAHGLRGHAYVSDDRGATWAEVAVDEPVLLMTACELDPGTVVLAGLGGHLFVSRDHGDTVARTSPARLRGTAEIVVAGDGGLVAAGEMGVMRVAWP